MKRPRISYLLVVGLAAGLGACRQTSQVTGNISVIEEDAACSAPVDGGVAPAAVAAGQQLATQMHCNGCHTSTLSGNSDTPINGGYPSNLTPDPETGIGCIDDATLVAAILDGVGPKGALCGMPKFRTKLAGDAGADPEAVAREIVQYLRTVPPVVDSVRGPCANRPDAGD